MQMNIILLKDVEGLGKKYDTVTVKGGYGRNFLIPKKMAIVANKVNTATIGSKLHQIKAQRAKLIAEIEALATKIQAKTIQIGAKVGTTGKIFGSVNNVQLADAIKAQMGVEVDRRKITIIDEVKALGTYKAKVDLGQGYKYDIEFEVVAE